MGISSVANLVPVLIIMFGLHSANTFYNICYPTFPEFDQQHRPVPRFGPHVKDNSTLTVQLTARRDGSRRETKLAEHQFVYNWDHFEGVDIPITVNVSRSLMDSQRDANIWLHASVLFKGQEVANARGRLVKYITKPEVRPKSYLGTGVVCEAPKEVSFAGSDLVAKGIPKLQVQLVHDTMHYPPPWAQGTYQPRLYVDEFWLTNDALISLNGTEQDKFTSQVSFQLMSSARWRFQMHMEQALAQNAAIFGEDSEEMLQMRDLMANTDPLLLIVTMITSFLHMIFEYLAFKADVNFWKQTDGDVIHKFISIKSIVAGIFCQIVLIMYLHDEQSNLLVLAISGVAILVDVWKVRRVMQVHWIFVCYVIPIPSLENKHRKIASTKKGKDGAQEEQSSDFDGQACKWLGLSLLPIVVCYSAYSFTYDCHRSYYSFVLSCSAALVYTLGFVLMTPQLFINYKLKSVAHLPWRRFVYRAINTFIDDLFSFIIRMPTMHRLSCFRDDAVFIVYLWQRWVYPVDKDRSYDEDDGEHQKKD